MRKAQLKRWGLPVTEACDSFLQRAIKSAKAAHMSKADFVRESVRRSLRDWGHYRASRETEIKRISKKEVKRLVEMIDEIKEVAFHCASNMATKDFGDEYYYWNTLVGEQDNPAYGEIYDLYLGQGLDSLREHLLTIPRD